MPGERKRLSIRRAIECGYATKASLKEADRLTEDERRLIVAMVLKWETSLWSDWARDLLRGAGAGGTKTYLRDFLFPTFEKHGLRIVVPGVEPESPGMTFDAPPAKGASTREPTAEEVERAAEVIANLTRDGASPSPQRSREPPCAPRGARNRRRAEVLGPRRA
jgi:hypothetical protein